MSLQLQNIFASKGVWRCKVQQDATIDDLALGVTELRQRGMARPRQTAGQLPGDVLHPRAGHTDDTEAAAARRRGDSANGVSRQRQSCA